MGRGGPISRQRARLWAEKMRQMDEFELKIRKYYPKKSISFYHGSHYQRMCVDNFNDPKSLIAERYRRSFFRNFAANVSQLCQIPNNLRHLEINTKSEIIFKKLIKQNKRLESLDFSSSLGETATMMGKYLKYSKSLCSIKFPDNLPLKSKMEYRKMLSTWGKTIENINIWSDEKDSNVIKTLLQLPRLKAFQLRNDLSSFPDRKIQERQIAYSFKLLLKNSESLIPLMKNQPNFDLTDYVNIQELYCSDTSKKMSLERHKIERNSKQKHFLHRASWSRPVESSLKPTFQNVASLDLSIPQHEWAYFSIEQLDHLKHLSIRMRDYTGSHKDNFEDFFAYLNKNVAPNKQLETFLIKTRVGGQKKQNKDLAVSFFEACSATLKKVHLEFEYHNEEFDAAECFYEGLKKLKNLQALSLYLNFRETPNEKAIEKLCQILPKLKSLKEVDFNIQKNKYQGKPLSVKFPPRLERLGLGMGTSGAPFDASKAIWPLLNLRHLEFEFADFSSPKWSKVLHDTDNNNKRLEVLILKKAQNQLTQNEKKQIKERLNALMKESSHLKLIILAIMDYSEVMIFKRKNYLWSEINPLIKDIHLKENMKVNYIQSYE